MDGRQKPTQAKEIAEGGSKPELGAGGGIAAGGPRRTRAWDCSYAKTASPARRLVPAMIPSQFNPVSVQRIAWAAARKLVRTFARTPDPRRQARCAVLARLDSAARPR
jgi:hypothetical protein